MRALSLRLVVLTLVGAVAAMHGAHAVASAQAPPPYVAARDPAVGTWRLNLQKSKYYPGPAPQSEIRTYEADGEFLKARSSGSTARGGRRRLPTRRTTTTPIP